MRVRVKRRVCECFDYDSVDMLVPRPPLPPPFTWQHHSLLMALVSLPLWGMVVACSSIGHRSWGSRGRYYQLHYETVTRRMALVAEVDIMNIIIP